MTTPTDPIAALLALVGEADLFLTIESPIKILGKHAHLSADFWRIGVGDRNGLDIDYGTFDAPSFAEAAAAAVASLTEDANCPNMRWGDRECGCTGCYDGAVPRWRALRAGQAVDLGDEP